MPEGEGRSCPPGSDAEHMQRFVTASQAIEALSMVRGCLRRWQLEGPPPNPRAAAGDLASRVEAAWSAGRGLVAEAGECQARASAGERRLAELENLRSPADMAEALAASQRAWQAELDAMRRLAAEREAMFAEDTALAQRAARLQRENDDLRAQARIAVVEAARCSRRETALAEQVTTMLGPVSVMCRVRPLDSYPIELARAGGWDSPLSAPGSAARAFRAEGGDIIVEGSSGNARKFRMDRVLQSASQDDMFGAASPWVESVVFGGSACILAYGATASGKTFTLLGGGSGVDARNGIAYHALKRLLHARVGSQVMFSMVEVYCDQCRDLLHGAGAGGSEPPTLQCVRRQDSNGRLNVDCTQLALKSVEEAEDALLRGYRRRAADATHCNERSSRSHVVLMAELRHSAGEFSAGAESGGQLVLVDLAGSENVQRSGADEGGRLLVEAKAINRSLSALADVVEATAKNQTHVPFRNSKLTMLLEESLSVSKVLLLVHVSPLAQDIENTRHSLNFAERIRASDFVAQSRKRDARERDQTEISKLGSQLDRAKQELSQVMQEKQDLMRQVAQVTEQIREQQRQVKERCAANAKAEDTSTERRPEPNTGFRGARPGSMSPMRSVPKLSFPRPKSPEMRASRSALHEGQPPRPQQHRGASIRDSTPDRDAVPHVIPPSPSGGSGAPAVVVPRSPLGDVTNAHVVASPLTINKANILADYVSAVSAAMPSDSLAELAASVRSPVTQVRDLAPGAGHPFVKRDSADARHDAEVRMHSPTGARANTSSMLAPAGIHNCMTRTMSTDSIRFAPPAGHDEIAPRFSLSPPGVRSFGSGARDGTADSADHSPAKLASARGGNQARSALRQPSADGAEDAGNLQRFRVRFCDDEVEAYSPPKWYLDLLEGDHQVRPQRSSTTSATVHVQHVPARASSPPPPLPFPAPTKAAPPYVHGHGVPAPRTPQWPVSQIHAPRQVRSNSSPNLHVPPSPGSPMPVLQQQQQQQRTVAGGVVRQRVRSPEMRPRF